MSEPCDLSAVEARRLIGRRKLSPVELLESCLERIAATNDVVNAIVAMDETAAREAARRAEQQVMRGDELGLIHGLPVAVKDLQDVAGMRTTYGSLLYKDHVPSADSTMVAKLRDEGGVILAKSNTPEFGAGANTKNRVYGATGNPFDPVKSAAGSSGGAAAALALGQVPLATGSDYGGSLRTPAGFCGVAGFRPSPGIVPGETRAASLIPFSVLGPMGRSIEDAHLLLMAQAGLDKADPFSSSDWLSLPEKLGGVDLSTVRAAFSADLGCSPIDRNIASLFASRTATFRGVFAESVDRNPDMANVHETFEILRGVYFVAAHRERLETRRELLDRNVIDNTERGLTYSLGDVAWANVEQSKIYKRFLALFDEIDVLICPIAAVSPFPHADPFVGEINGEKMPTYMRWLSLTYALTMALPAVAAIPCGLDHNGMPFGIQVVGPNGSDALVLEVAHALEQVLAQNKETARPVPDWRALQKTA
jgi:amidase